ncbi:hypothetical protein L596_016790 [Steinernema carpocapsae]|uniref:UTP23 sensor motif region domain-containing protein n=1 Tax=Steinernema carpocapsae TaxID=34508 RepID=A0A4U5NK09_STECR|nr:hypothetical protein L596_016790 [Steinernema carpocapsae]
MPKYLGCEVDIVTTSCIVQELEKLGKNLFGALNICKQFDVVPCRHKPAKAASDCQLNLARRAERPEEKKFIMATQQQSVLEKLREMKHVPALFIRFNAILFDKLGLKEDNSEHKNEDELKRLQEMKKSILGIEERGPRKRKGPKGPNPLSVKKKKVAPSPAPKKPEGGDAAKPEKKKRRRKNKAAASKAPGAPTEAIESKE